MQTAIRILVALLASGACVARGAGFDRLYTAHVGDLNGDGLTDIYLKKDPRIVFLDVGDIATPIVTSPRQVGEFYLSNLGNGQFALSALSATQLSAVRQWPESEIDVIVRHINFDSAPDAQLIGVDEVISGALDQLIFASEVNNEIPVALRAMDAGLQKFVFESFAWSLDVNYFRNNARPSST